MSGGLVLLTGASGYVGGRLLRALEADGRPLRCMARRPDHLRSRVAGGTEVVAGDVLDPQSLGEALRGVHTAYYLIHSMGTSRDYAENDRRGAESFAKAARDAGVQRIVYLGRSARVSGSPATSRAGRKSAGSSASPAYRRSSSAPRSSSARAASRSSWSARWSRSCRRW